MPRWSSCARDMPRLSGGLRTKLRTRRVSAVSKVLLVGIGRLSCSQLGCTGVCTRMQSALAPSPAGPRVDRGPECCGLQQGPLAEQIPVPAGSIQARAHRRRHLPRQAPEGPVRGRVLRRGMRVSPTGVRAMDRPRTPALQRRPRTWSFSLRRASRSRAAGSTEPIWNVSSVAWSTLAMKMCRVGEYTRRPATAQRRRSTATDRPVSQRPYMCAWAG